jgi:hypothetical protein
MSTIHIKSIIYIFWLCFTLAACSLPSSSDEVTSEMTVKQTVMVGNTAERIASMRALLRMSPMPLLDAQHAEQQYGDDHMGPADYQGFYYLQAPVAQVHAWTATLTPLQQRPNYDAPTPSQPWWLTQQAFNALKFYEVTAVTYRAQGWVGVNAQTGKIYIHDYTT